MKKRDGNQSTPEAMRAKLEELISNFAPLLKNGHLRNKVLALVEVLNHLRKLGKSLITKDEASGARNRILHYFKKYSATVISGDEILIISGIQEYARRIRELRVQFGWKIISGKTAKAMAKVEDDVKEPLRSQFAGMGPDDYYLANAEQDKEAAYRWNVANSIRRKKSMGGQERMLEYLKVNVEKPVTGEELRYIANADSEWARRVRELRTQKGWAVLTKNTGRPDLPVGVYVLESLRQSPEHDRIIPDDVRVAVLERDKHKCTKCGWQHGTSTRSDSRHLELHHIKHHVKGGDNTLVNLTTLCNIHHDAVHRKDSK